jgi:hypothetical protein
MFGSFRPRLQRLRSHPVETLCLKNGVYGSASIVYCCIEAERMNRFSDGPRSR